MIRGINAVLRSILPKSVFPDFVGCSGGLEFCGTKILANLKMMAFRIWQVCIANMRKESRENLLNFFCKF